ncbi:cupin-like domain-containing protein [Paraburkholderia phenazinium]|uniref:Cupin-like domain-containing protein n=1 Tax=Paraburkholderia phenazinium TaxID=60549 RepID=A0A1G8B782_9BURK|nr:cupin-like domain-containing protein [Paraburkholderia phenazinium]SDH29028.1 Cupin-like domain-containing protein [Paraburkholderia phenazinium]
MNANLLDLLVARLAEHYVALPQAAAVDLIVSDDPQYSRRFVLGRVVEMRRLPDEGSGFEGAVTANSFGNTSGKTSAADLPQAATRITTTYAVLAAMLADPTGFDARSAAVLQLGGVRIEGAARLAAYWLQLLKRPSDEGRAALSRARERAPHWLDAVSVFEAAHINHERAPTVSPDTAIATALDRSVPLHLRGVLRWPETAWTLTDWRKHEASTVLRMNPANGQPQSVGTFIDALETPEAPEAPGSNTAAEPPYTEGCLLPAAWEARFEMPVLSAPMFGPAQLWFGRRREHALVTRLHCDLANSFLAQVHGRKRVRLYSPSQDEVVYAFDAFNTYRPCRVDAAAPDLARFPRFAEARGVDVVIEPGDLLVIPTGWFHCVWALDHVLSISRFVSEAQAAALASHLRI